MVRHYKIMICLDYLSTPIHEYIKGKMIKISSSVYEVLSHCLIEQLFKRLPTAFTAID